MAPEVFSNFFFSAFRGKAIQKNKKKNNDGREQVLQTLGRDLSPSPSLQSVEI